MRELSREEELAFRTKSFQKLKPGCLFDLGGKRFFIFIKKGSGAEQGNLFEIPEVEKKFAQVIELTPDNRKKIIDGGLCNDIILSFDEMSCLNFKD